MMSESFLETLNLFLAEYQQSNFDTHCFIRDFSRQHQREYIIELYSLIEIKYPFQNLHSSIGKFLSNSPHLKRDGDNFSDDIFQNEQNAVKWIRI
jgi:hypothetical protein